MRYVSVCGSGMRALGLSRQKATYARALAGAEAAREEEPPPIQSPYSIHNKQRQG